jgi:hypothetical protein
MKLRIEKKVGNFSPLFAYNSYVGLKALLRLKPDRVPALLLLPLRRMGRRLRSLSRKSWWGRPGQEMQRPLGENLSIALGPTTFDSLG